MTVRHRIPRRIPRTWAQSPRPHGQRKLLKLGFQMKVVPESPNFTTYFSQMLFTASDVKFSMSPCLSAGTQFCTGHGTFQLAAPTHWGCYNWVCTATALNNTRAIRGLPCAHNSQMLRPSFNVWWQRHSIIMKCSMAASLWYWTVIPCQSTPVASALPRKKNENQPNTQTNKKTLLILPDTLMQHVHKQELPGISFCFVSV